MKPNHCCDGWRGRERAREAELARGCVVSRGESGQDVLALLRCFWTQAHRALPGSKSWSERLAPPRRKVGTFSPGPSPPSREHWCRAEVTV